MVFGVNRSRGGYVAYPCGSRRIRWSEMPLARDWHRWPTPYEWASLGFAFAAFVSVLGYLVSRASDDVSRSHPEKRTAMSSYWSICAIALRKGASEICMRP